LDTYFTMQLKQYEDEISTLRQGAMQVQAIKLELTTLGSGLDAALSAINRAEMNSEDQGSHAISNTLPFEYDGLKGLMMKSLTCLHSIPSIKSRLKVRQVA
jgi:hypothetical protein